MSLFEVIAILITLSALLSYINFKIIKLPATIGLMVLALVLSVCLNIAGYVFPVIIKSATNFLKQVDFNQALLHGLLGFFLFAGALHVNINKLAEHKITIAILAVFGTISSAIIVASLMYWLLGILDMQMDFIYCLLFGVLISPTDPIAVMGILKSLGTPKDLEVKIVGESLFNDGVSVVLFLALLGVATGKQEVSASHLTMLFITEALGGALFGIVIGGIAYYMLKSMDNYRVEILISLALVMGGYALAERLHISAPIAIVVAGLITGNHSRKFAMSDNTREHLDSFWDLLDDIFNAVLFVLIGLEVLALTVNKNYLLDGLLASLVVLFARWVSVSVPLKCIGLRREFVSHSIKTLTWGGLRGGISVALALSLHETIGKENHLAFETILRMTYMVVIFSILVQGLSIGPLIKKLYKN